MPLPWMGQHGALRPPTYHEQEQQVYPQCWNKDTESKTFTFLVVVVLVLATAAHARVAMVIESVIRPGQCDPPGAPCQGDYQCCDGICAVVGERDLCS
ncbi:hypothetical protein V6N13_038215 [Hibiscus sabdariffa]|uniref:Uncharacterized protein n=1 Tax=Hibiscus sabdariffa TaxID=183260 RepID=A0ABR2S2L4_9ROSI